MEMLLYTAELKLPMSMTWQQKVVKVMAIIQQLALTTCMNVRIGSAVQRGISGAGPPHPQSSLQTVKSGAASPGLLRAAACCDAVTSALRWPDSVRRCHASDARKLVPAQPSNQSERHRGSAAADCCQGVCAQAGSASALILE